MKWLMALCVTVTLLASCAAQHPAVQGVTMAQSNMGCVIVGNVQAQHYVPTPRTGDDKAVVINKMKQEVKDMGGNALLLEWYEDGVGQGIAMYCPFIEGLDVPMSFEEGPKKKDDA